MLSLDPHWFSTLFGWYNFATFWVAGLSMIALIIIHLKKNGHFTHVNENHLHDLGKFMFAFSIFWTYLWFSQFMLIWYADIPEEVTYYMDRYTNYAVPFFSLIVINFAFPILLMMSRDAKRNFKFIRLAAVVIIFGHWLDVFIMVMPGTVKGAWGFGFLEIGMLAGFVGAFMFVVLNALSKAALVPKNHPFLEESEHHHVM
jgi:Ni/Fe-hydrogenase subunit HybB-like protein